MAIRIVLAKGQRKRRVKIDEGEGRILEEPDEGLEGRLFGLPVAVRAA